MSLGRLEDVRFRYPGEAAEALAGVSLPLEPGHVTWLTGALGSGCTTTLLVAAGLAPRVTGGERSGTVEVLGVDPGSTEAAAVLAGQVAFVTATPAVQLSGVATTVREEVAFAPANLGWARDRIRSAVDRSLERLGVAHLAARDPGTLSGGEQQRVVLAAMLAVAPRLWLLDEPASALDAQGRGALYQLLAEVAREGAAVVVASEDADGLAPVADRLHVVRDGVIALSGEPGPLLAGEQIWSCGAGSTAVAELARMAGRLHADPRLAFPYPITVDEAVRRWSV